MYKRQQYYSADISRTFPISGKFTAEERYYYEAVLKAQEAILQALKPGYPIDDTLELARDTMYPYCREAGTAKDRADMVKLLPHGVCHYLGLDTHDVGDRVEVCEGMTVAIEPGLYFPEKEMCIRDRSCCMSIRAGILATTCTAYVCWTRCSAEI